MPTKNQEADYVTKIIEYINKNNYKSGDKLPTNIALAEHFEVSVSVIRTALIKLESLGIISIRPRSGSFVESLDINLLIKLFSIFLQQAVKDAVPGLLSTYELKQILDAELFSMGAKTRTPIELYELNQILQKQKELIDDKVEFVLLDEEFHEKVAEMTRNPLIQILYKILHNMLREDRTTHDKITHEYRETILNDHEELYNLIQKQDTENAMIHARIHAERRLKSILNE